MATVKYPLPVDVVIKAQLEAAGFQTLPDVERYVIIPADDENPILKDGKPLKLIAAYVKGPEDRPLKPILERVFVAHR